MSENGIPRPDAFQVDPDRLRETIAEDLSQLSGGRPRFGRCGTLLDSPELDWIWKLPPEQLQRFLLAAVGGTFYPDAYYREGRRLMLHLIIDAPTGPPTGPIEFIQSCTVEELARKWGGSTVAAAWTGVPGYDVLIAAFLEGRFPTLAAIAAEFANLFRSWALDPQDAIHTAAEVFGDNQ